MEKLSILILVWLGFISNLYTYTPLIYRQGQVFNMGQPYGVRIFDNYMHEKGSFAQGFQWTPSTESGAVLDFEKHNIGEYLSLKALITYHQNLYKVLDGLFFQTHIPLGGGITGKGANINLTTGYYFLNKPSLITALHINSVFCGDYYGTNGTLQEPQHQKIGFSLCSWAKIIGNEYHKLLLFNELRYHHKFAGYWSKHKATFKHNLGGIVDAIAGLTYQYKSLFISGGFDGHLTHGMKVKTSEEIQQRMSSLQAINTYADVGFHNSSACYCSMGITYSFLFRGYERLETSIPFSVAFKTAVAF